MEKTKSVQSLKRQLTAAIAMVLVAAIALISATYAWFVANNTVKAETNTISAQSNAPYLKIAAGASATIDTNTTTSAKGFDENPTDTALYPAQVTFTAGSDGANDTEKWESAYAEAKNNAKMKDGTRFTVGTSGNYSDATTKGYAHKESFTIGTDADSNGSFNNLKVESIVATNASTNPATTLTDALRILVVCENNHYVYDATGKRVDTYVDSTAVGNTKADATNGDVLAKKIKAKGEANKTVDVYLFYDGSHANVKTDALSILKDVGVNITFTATMVDPNGKESTGSNYVDETK